MYLSGAGRGAFWPAGEITDRRGRARGHASAPPSPAASPARSTPAACVWLGDLAASPVGDPRTSRSPSACDRYVDHYAYERKRGAGADAPLRHPRRGALAGARRRDRRARRRDREARLRRRHRAQRHPRALAADLAPQPLRAGPGRGPLPHRPRGLSRPARRRGHAGAVPASGCGASGGRAFRPAAFAACTGSSTASATTPRSAAFEADHERRPGRRLPAAVLRPALVPGRRGAAGDRAGRAEHRHRRRAPRP